MTSPTKTFLRNEQMASERMASVLKRNGEPSSSKQIELQQIHGWRLMEIFERMQSNDVKPSNANGCKFCFAWIARAVRTIGPPNPFEWLIHCIQMALRWKPQTTRNIFAWEVTILFLLYSFLLSLNPADIIVWIKICLFSSVLIIIFLPSRL